MRSSQFGIIDGKPVKLYTLSNKKIEVEILTYGGAVRSIRVPDKNKKITDVALGYDTVCEYVKNGGYIGALIGRVGNRIDEGKFSINGKKYQVGKNENGNSLHGGIKGFNAKIWQDEAIGEKLKLTYFSADGEEGYPGNVKVTVIYSLEDSGLKIEYTAESDADTLINLTNHAYFNLNGQGNGSILNTLLTIDADKITPVDKDLIPHGEFLDVSNTPFDFREEKKIGKEIFFPNKIMEFCGGYDINYVLNGEGFRKIATAKSPVTGIEMEVYTDQKGVQFYSGNFLTGVKGKNNSSYCKRDGFCLETQNYPNAINCKEYPSMILRKGEIYKTATVYKFN